MTTPGCLGRPCGLRASARCPVPGALALLASVILCAAVSAQSTASLDQNTPDLESKLEQRGDLVLRDATLLEALFAIRESWNVNIVFGNDITGEVNGAFSEASLRDILDAILLPRGFGYRIVGKSLVVVRLEELGTYKPFFKNELIPVEYADPQQILTAVEPLLSPSGKVLAVASSRCLAVLDYPERIELVRQQVAQLDRRAASVPQISTGGAPSDDTSAAPITLDVAYFRPEYVKAESLLEALQQLLGENGKVSAIPKENRIVVVDSPQQLQVIARAIEQLDLPRPQVRISALIYDASLDDLRRLGVNWRSIGKGHNLDESGVAQDRIVLDTVTNVAPPVGTVNGTLSFFTGQHHFDLAALVHALDTASDSKLLADPTVTVQDQEEASIDIVREIPYQQLTQGLEGGNIGTTAFREAGVKLKVTPQIASDNTINMFVIPEFSLLAGFTEGDNQPIIDRRTATTTVRVANLQTFVIGGLRQRAQVIDNTKIPFFGDLGYGLGHLFRHRSYDVRESELIVFITPQIVGSGWNGRSRDSQAWAFGQQRLDHVPIPQLECPELETEMAGGWHQPAPGSEVPPVAGGPPEVEMIPAPEEHEPIRPDAPGAAPNQSPSRQPSDDPPPNPSPDTPQDPVDDASSVARRPLPARSSARPAQASSPVLSGRPPQAGRPTRSSLLAPRSPLPALQRLPRTETTPTDGSGPTSPSTPARLPAVRIVQPPSSADRAAAQDHRPKPDLARLVAPRKPPADPRVAQQPSTANNPPARQP